jgi:hypothetical protein
MAGRVVAGDKRDETVRYKRGAVSKSRKGSKRSLQVQRGL